MERETTYFKCPLTLLDYDEIISYQDGKARQLITTDEKRTMTIKNLAPGFLDFNESFCVKKVRGKIIKIYLK